VFTGDAVLQPIKLRDETLAIISVPCAKLYVELKKLTIGMRQ
jgi:hypothetical protein